jgi:O-antigen/teichoic acid export membrane protein
MQSISTASERDNTIFWAVITSLASKMGTLLLRVISIPIAIRVLGVEEFGVYSTITIVAAMVNVMIVGLGPTLTQRLSKAVAENNQKIQQQTVATALLFTGVVTLILSVIFCLGVWLIPIPVLFGERFAPFALSMKSACLLAMVIMAIDFFCLQVERIRDGFMETRINNIWGTLGNFTGAIALFAAIQHFPNILCLLIAVNGSVALAKLGNAIHFFCQRPFLFHWIRDFSGKLLKPLVSSSAVFTITYSLSALVEYSALGYLAGRYLGPEAAATCAILVTVHFSLTGILQMFTIPAWPALIDARARQDFNWIRKTTRKIQTLSVLFGLGVFLILAFAGLWLIKLWVAVDLEIGGLGMLMFGAFFAIHVWRHANQMLLLSFEQQHWVALITTIEATMVLAVIWALFHGHGTLDQVYMGVSLVIVAISGWLFPTRLKSQLQQLN